MVLHSKIHGIAGAVPFSPGWHFHGVLRRGRPHRNLLRRPKPPGGASVGWGTVIWKARNLCCTWSSPTQGAEAPRRANVARDPGLCPLTFLYSLMYCRTAKHLYEKNCNKKSVWIYRRPKCEKYNVQKIIFFIITFRAQTYWSEHTLWTFNVFTKWLTVFVFIFLSDIRYHILVGRQPGCTGRNERCVSINWTPRSPKKSRTCQVSETPKQDRKSVV